jgi:hypothetical protein
MAGRLSVPTRSAQTGESAVNGAQDARHRRTRAATRKGFTRAWRARSRSRPLTARETVLPRHPPHEERRRDDRDLPKVALRRALR